MDQGDISYAMPGINVEFSIPAGPGGTGPHNPGFAEAAGTLVAFRNCLRAGKATAGVAVDVSGDTEFLEEVRREFILQSKIHSRKVARLNLVPSPACCRMDSIPHLGFWLQFTF
ncbi:hypothetical protein F5Y08DRAFT_347910 [Xylaria arbuscula]|nr:hypothetical protein F5Y08DRAFT_347910 [Xylaria arbuscula]